MFDKRVVIADHIPAPVSHFFMTMRRSPLLWIGLIVTFFFGSVWCDSTFNTTDGGFTLHDTRYSVISMLSRLELLERKLSPAEPHRPLSGSRRPLRYEHHFRLFVPAEAGKNYYHLNPGWFVRIPYWMITGFWLALWSYLLRRSYRRKLQSADALAPMTAAA